MWVRNFCVASANDNLDLHSQQTGIFISGMDTYTDEDPWLDWSKMSWIPILKELSTPNKNAAQFSELCMLTSVALSDFACDL